MLRISQNELFSCLGVFKSDDDAKFLAHKKHNSILFYDRGYLPPLPPPTADGQLNGTVLRTVETVRSPNSRLSARATVPYQPLHPRAGRTGRAVAAV